MGKAKQAKITETLSTESSGGDIPTQLNNQQKEILSEALKIPEPPTYKEIMPPTIISPGLNEEDKSTWIPTPIIPTNINGDLNTNITSDPPMNTVTINSGVDGDGLAKTPQKVRAILSSGQMDSNGDIIPLTEVEVEIDPEKKSSFINDLIKKPLEEVIIDDTSHYDNFSTAPQPIPKTASHYARRNISSLKDKVSAVVARQSYVDAVNVEDRGVFKCHPDKPIKN
jgi:hypothetical protein